MTLKLLSSINVIENEYFIPVKTKEVKVPITDIYCPVDSPDLNRDNYIMCELKSTTQSNGQVTIAYNVDNSSLDNIRAFI